ncbi:MAG: hypothetical protein GEU28_01195 [Dehalococcoidia bacterium]|nr:hypothetical protein [Dehalococcoidia bacterium]
MYNEMGLTANRDEVAAAIESADVFLVGFRNTTERLVVDTRQDEKTAPMIETSESTGSLEGRMHWLGQRRPEFGLPEAFKFFVWPNSMEWLVASGTWEGVRAKLVGQGHDEWVAAQMGKALEDLYAVELQTARDAIVGNGYMTIWPVQRETDE